MDLDDLHVRGGHQLGAGARTTANSSGLLDSSPATPYRGAHAGDRACSRILLKETVPRISRVAYLTNTGLRVPDSAGRILRMTLLPVTVDAPDGLQPALADIARQHVDAVFVADGIIFWAQRYAIVEFAAKQRLPTMYPYDI